MYKISPPAVYAHSSVMNNPDYRRKVERVVEALAEPRDIIPYDDEDLPDIIRDNGILGRMQPMGRLAVVEDPVLVFNTFRFGKETMVQETKEQLKNTGISDGHQLNALAGSGAFVWVNCNKEGDVRAKERVCRPCWRIHLESGCLHRCSYCDLGGLLVCMVNIDEYIERLSKLMQAHPWQQTYLLDDDADPPGLEPELDLVGPLVEYFGTLDDRYLILHTKTWNTDWLTALKHSGNTIIVWSLSGAMQSRELEPHTGTTAERIAAAQTAQSAGYQVRYKFKPIIPVRTWRADAEEAVRMIFEQTNPDVISLCTLMWMDYDALKTQIPLELLDPDLVAAAANGQEETKNKRTGPFPEHARVEIYRHYLKTIRKYSKDIPVSLSTESWSIWQLMEKELEMTATDYVCGCGPRSTPGKSLLTKHPFTEAVRSGKPFEGVL